MQEAHMAKLIFLRHAHSTANEKGILAGRSPGISLSERGEEQANALAERFGDSEIDFIFSSPLERCHQTIEPWLRSSHSRSLTSFEIADGLIEMEYGKWSGRKLSSLSREPMWRDIQNSPSRVQFPEGEKFRQMQKRALAVVDSALQRSPKSHHLFVSHGDVIKSIISSKLGMALDNFQRLVIDPASITILEGDSSGFRMTVFNDTTSNVSAYLTRKKAPKNLLGGGAGRK